MTIFTCILLLNMSFVIIISVSHACNKVVCGLYAYNSDFYLYTIIKYVFFIIISVSHACNKVVCGRYAYCNDGKCVCMHGYVGDPHKACRCKLHYILLSGTLMCWVNLCSLHSFVDMTILSC